MVGSAVEDEPNELVAVTTTAAPPQPPNWDQACKQANDSPDRFIKIRVEPFTPEYRTLSDLIHSAPNLEVTGIQRVVNVQLWKRFLNMRDDSFFSNSDDVGLLRNLGLTADQIQQHVQTFVNFNANKGIPSYADNVALLLHCTGGSVDKILGEGLDELFAKDTGLLGRGIYFTDSPRKAAAYDKNNVFIVCAVFLGDCSQVMGRKPYVRGQEKTDSQKRHKHDDYFDSIVGRPVAANSDNEFVIYDRRQCVPIYLIQYQRKTKPASTSVRSKMYSEARYNYPPFAWYPAQAQNPFPGHSFMASPLVLVPARVNRWPFFAQTIFGLMSQGSDAATTETPKPTDNMAQLRSMGFTNDQINAQKLADNNNDLNRTVEALLTLNHSPPASAFIGQPQTFPSATAISQTSSPFYFRQIPPVSSGSLFQAAPNLPSATAISQTSSPFYFRQIPPVSSGSLFQASLPSATAQAPTFAFSFITAPAQSTNSFLRPTSAPAAQTFPNPFHLTAASFAYPTANPLLPSTSALPGFGFASNTTTGPFGTTSATAQASWTTGPFGTTAATAQAPTTTGIFGTTAATAQAPTTTGIFGTTATTAQAPTTTGIFGTTASTGQVPTANPFNPNTCPAAFSAQALTTTSPSQSASNGSTAQQQEECLICRDEPTNWKTLPCCSQKICTTCYAQLHSSGKTMSGFTCTFVKCPFCKRVEGIEIGSCPDGEMTSTISNLSLDGHAGYGTIEVCYTVRAWNLHRIGYLPNSPEGNRALNLLKIAWDRRLVFSIGTSRTTGQSNVLVWNIHHKTGTSGGVQNHAYPDPTYLDRLLDELKQYRIQ